MRDEIVSRKAIGRASTGKTVGQGFFYTDSIELILLAMCRVNSEESFGKRLRSR